MSYIYANLSDGSCGWVRMRGWLWLRSTCGSGSSGYPPTVPHPQLEREVVNSMVPSDIIRIRISPSSLEP